ncbi:MAG: N-acetyl-gamma-glutamyl-phosphate reductase [Nitrospina sp.]|nr:N-acetyl-gamma-glutamyl-phosphate reductase [Nitrospina sp.]|tara:strand:+ start:596 stop:1633 length:1038 start_codon:yes stop_codon:yes gene_type:complete
MIKVGIAGASGYTGLELIRLLANHTKVKLSVLTSETYQNNSIADVFPSLNGIIDINLQSLDSQALQSCDVVFLALPHTAGMDLVPQLMESDCKVIDLSADYRLKNPDDYLEWYSVTHTHPELLSQVVYGLPELNREKIKNAKGVANPGCYPTSVILALAPLLKTDWIDFESIISDSKSGISGAGRKTSITTHFAEANEGLTPYSLVNHRHTPEIEQELSNLAGKPIKISFSPHLIPMNRGMLSTIYINLTNKLNDEHLTEHYEKFYGNEFFVRILDKGKFAKTQSVSGSNFCDIGIKLDNRVNRLVLTSAIDNLIKGASGQAIQNMNIMLGFEEKTGLQSPAIFP